MDFSKLNIEFMNMQKMLKKYYHQTTKIKTRIKNNLKEINKYEARVKSSKDAMVKGMYKVIITAKKEENNYLKDLLIEEKLQDETKANNQ